MPADYLSSRPAGNAARYGQMADTSRTRRGRSELDRDYLVAVHIIEYRGVSGLGVSQTPRPWKTKPSKTLTADDNNFVLMQRLGYESPSRGSRAMLSAHLHAKSLHSLYRTSTTHSAAAGATAEVNLVWFFLN